MNIPRSILIIVGLSLTSCTSIKCHNSGGNHDHDFGYKKTDKLIIEDTSEKKYFYPLTPVKSFSGIESLNLKGSSLILTLKDYGYFEQYLGPVVNQIRETHVEARPFLALFGSIGTIGIMPLVAPRMMGEMMVGCTEKKLLSSEPDLTRKVKTGKSEWRYAEKTHKILIYGFDKDYETSSLSKEAIIDLSPYILNTDLVKNTTLTITCLDCDLKGQEEHMRYKELKKTVEINADFRGVKESLVNQSRKTVPASKPEQELKPLLTPQTGELE